jgi:uncharacterized coiled-coil protein SlyX
MRRISSLLVLSVLLACEPGGLGRNGRASAVDSIATLNRQLAQAQATAAQQDSVMQSFTQATALLDSIDREIAKVKGLKSHVPLELHGDSARDPRAAYRASLLGKVREVTALLRENRARVRALSAENAALREKTGQYEQTIATLQAMVDRQTQEIAELTGRVDSLASANTALVAAKAAMSDTVQTLRRENNTVYYIVGTKKELMERGIIVEEGSRFLFFGHKALVPARQLDPAAFTAMDKWSHTPIPLHSADRPFKIISRQDPSLVEAEKGPDGKPNGTLRITDPARFWSTSRFLIIVEG